MQGKRAPIQAVSINGEDPKVKPNAISGVRSLALGCAIIAVCGWAGPAKAQAAGQWKDGLHLYTKVCANCHESGVGPIIRGRGEELAPEYYQFVVRNGLRAMPAFRPTDIDAPTLKQLSEMLPHMAPPGGGK